MLIVEWTEHPNARQATRKDLADIARALGVEVTVSMTVPTLRRLIRAELARLAALESRETTKPSGSAR